MVIPFFLVVQLHLATSPINDHDFLIPASKSTLLYFYQTQASIIFYQSKPFIILLLPFKISIQLLIFVP
jgi:hypothetical protein